LPNILIIVLNRGKNNYFNVNIEFNQELNLNRYYQKLEYNIDEMNHDVSPKYNLLCGTILEKDYYNTGKGHTIAFATDYHGKYTIYDDNKIKDNEEFQNIKNKDAYILFYQMEKKNTNLFK
jgi:ubiquitin C-terminal hydrolase